MEAGDIAIAKNSLQRDGFAAVKKVFDDASVREVHQIFKELTTELKGHNGLGRLSLADMRPLNEECTDVMSDPQLEILYPSILDRRLTRTNLFKGACKLVNQIAGPLYNAFDHAIFKAANTTTTTPWHQDIAFRKTGLKSPEHVLSRLHLWIPLQDTGLEQGCMEFVAGSHLAPPQRHRPFHRQSGSKGFEAVVVPDGMRVACPLPLGSLTIHTPSTLHATGPNRTDHDRAAWIIQFSRLGNVERFVKQLVHIAPRTVTR